ncbi:hypothetical protein, partial [Sinorhizobium fredii]|uniref:hypothetical protein n=1 Tax=Rhizobium fredii TaxID=380 RepID=UPI001FCC4BA4
MLLPADLERIAPDIHGSKDVAGLFSTHFAMAGFRLMLNPACDLNIDPAAQACTSQHGLLHIRHRRAGVFEVVRIVQTRGGTVASLTGPTVALLNSPVNSCRTA